MLRVSFSGMELSLSLDGFSWWDSDADILSAFVVCRLKTHFEDNPVELGERAKVSPVILTIQETCFVPS
jgi:hypothetical protein